MIKTCIFDLDGTLLDTLMDLYNSVNEALVIHKLPSRSEADIRSFVGNGVAKLVERAVPFDTPPELNNRVFNDFVRIYNREKSHHTAPYPGICDLLETLQLSGIQLAVLSNKPDPAVADLIQLHFPGIFNLTLGARDGISKKPSPDGLNYVMKQLGAKPKETLYIGDTEVDIATAKAAGVTCIAVAWGFRNKTVLMQAGAENLIDTPDDMLPLLFHA